MERNESADGRGVLFQRKAHAPKVRSTFAIGYLEYLERYLRSCAVNWLSRKNNKKTDLQLCCFPRDYIGKNIVANGFYEELVLRCLFEDVFKSRLEMFSRCTVLDVGANLGNHSCWFSGFFAAVIAFEPNPLCVRLFEANVLMNGLRNVRLFKVALSDRNGSATFCLNRTGNIGGSRLTEESTGEDTIDVDVSRGDDLLGDALGTVALVKIDVEGHEHAALRGMEDIVRRHKPIIMFESAGSTGAEGSHAVLDTLSTWGYNHTYVVEPDQEGSWPVRALRRMVGGFRMRVESVVKPADRYYSLILASAEPL